MQMNKILEWYSSEEHDTCFFLLGLFRLPCNIYNSPGNFSSTPSYSQRVLVGCRGWRANGKDEKESLVAVKNTLKK